MVATDLAMREAKLQEVQVKGRLSLERLGMLLGSFMVMFIIAAGLLFAYFAPNGIEKASGMLVAVLTAVASVLGIYFGQKRKSVAGHAEPASTTQAGQRRRKR